MHISKQIADPPHPMSETDFDAYGCVGEEAEGYMGAARADRKTRFSRQSSGATIEKNGRRSRPEGAQSYLKPQLELKAGAGVAAVLLHDRRIGD